MDDNFIDDGDLEDSCYNNGYGMGIGNGSFGDDFDGLHDLEDDDMHSSQYNLSGSKSRNNASAIIEGDDHQRKEDEREQRKYNQILQRFRVILP